MLLFGLACGYICTGSYKSVCCRRQDWPLLKRVWGTEEDGPAGVGVQRGEKGQEGRRQDGGGLGWCGQGETLPPPSQQGGPEEYPLFAMKCLCHSGVFMENSVFRHQPCI